MSQRNFSAKEWGPHFWKTMHFVAHSYPDYPTNKQKRHYESFFKSFNTVLPCSVCRKSFNVYYTKLPIKKFLRDRLHLTYWVYIIHQKVNRKLGKCCLLKFKNACKMYERHRVSSEKVMKCNENKIRYRKGATRFLEKKYLNKKS